MNTLLLCTLLNLAAVPAPEAFPAGDHNRDSILTCALTFAGSDPQEPIRVETMPKLLTRVEPVYPREAREQGVEGKVFVQLVVNPDGRVSEATVLKSDAGILNQAALDAARKYIFTPASKGQPAVPVKVVIPFQFKLSEKSGDGTHARSYPIFSLIENLLYGPVDSTQLASVHPGATLILQNRIENLRWELLHGKTLRDGKFRTVFQELYSDEGASSATVVMITEAKAKRYHTVNLVRGNDRHWQIRFWHISE